MSSTSSSSSPSRGQTSTPTPQSVASASASAKVNSASAVSPDPSAAAGASGNDDDGGQGQLLSSAQLATYRLPSSPVPTPNPSAKDSHQPSLHSHSHQSSHSSLQLQDSLQAQGAKGFKAQVQVHQQGPSQAVASSPSSLSQTIATTLQDQKPITTVSIHSPTSTSFTATATATPTPTPSTPTSPLVHTLHAKPFTPSKPPNLAAAPFIPSFATTPLAASLLTNPANTFALTSIPRQLSFTSPTKSTSPTRTKATTATTATQYPSPDPSPRTATVATPPMAIKPAAPLTPTPTRVDKSLAGVASAGPRLTPPRSPSAAAGKSSHVNPQLQRSLWTQVGHGGGDKRDVFGQLAHQLSSLDVKVGAGETKEEREASRMSRAAATAAMYAEQQPVIAMAAEVGPSALMHVPPPSSYYHSASSSAADRPVKGEPDACLFVASLNAQRTDEQLTDSVTKHFAKWGDLMGVKVMKDWMNRPYAFVQYRLVADAQRAIDESHDTVVDGRHVRVEAARVNRTLFLSKLPKTMSDDVLHQFMSKWGKVEDVTLIMNQVTGRPKGCAFAKFRYREDAIRAYLHIRQQGKWGVEWAANLEKRKPETDRLSVFVGQLNPDEATEATVRAKFARYGTIENVHLIAADGEAFAFIKYDDETGSQLAINNENGKEFQGSRILVQYRESPEGKSPMVRRPLGREPKPLTRPQSNKPSSAISSSTGYVLTRPSTGYDRVVTFDVNQQDMDSNDDQAQLQQHQQQQQQQGAGPNPRSFHPKPNYSSATNPAGPTSSSSVSTYHSHHPSAANMHQHQQHGYPPYYPPPPHMYGGYYGYPGYYPPPHMPHHPHNHGGYYPPPPTHHHPHAYHGYPQNLPYGALPPHPQQQHQQPGTGQGQGGPGQFPQPQGYPGAQQDAYHAAVQQQLANASAGSGANADGGSASGGMLGGAMYDAFYGGVGYPPVDPFSATVDLARHFATLSPAPLRIPTAPYPIVQAQQQPSAHPAPPAAAGASDSSKMSLPFNAQASTATAPKSLFSTLTASAAAGRAEHLESMYTQSLKSALAGLSSADAANTPLGAVMALSSGPASGAPAPPALAPGSSSANIMSAEGSLGGGDGRDGATGAASGSGSATPATLTSGFGNAFGSALFPPFAPGVGAPADERAGSAATRNASIGKRGSPEALVAGIVESGNAAYAPW